MKGGGGYGGICEGYMKIGIWHLGAHCPVGVNSTLFLPAIVAGYRLVNNNLKVKGCT